MTNYYAAVVHNFVPGSDRELALQVGERVMLFNWDDPEWWYGDLNGKSGYFPSTHVELLEEDDGVPPPPPPPADEDDYIPPPPPSTSSTHAVALWDCNAETQHELSFRAGENLLVLDDTNPDWLFVELRSKRGFQSLHTNLSKVTSNSILRLVSLRAGFRIRASQLCQLSNKLSRNSCGFIEAEETRRFDSSKRCRKR